MKFKEKPEQAIASAKTLLDIDYQIKDMSIYEWLRRLNMHQYSHKFKTIGGIRRVADLKHVGEGEIGSYGITALIDIKRVMEMI